VNQRTQEIITKLLDDEISWDKTTRELKFNRLIDAYRGWLESLFFEEVTIPVYSHVTALFRAVTREVDRDAHFEWDPGFWREGVGCWLIKECSDICPIERHADYLHELIDRRLDHIWRAGDDWDWSGPSEEEVLALGIRPGAVPKVVDQHGNVQNTLF